MKINKAKVKIYGQEYTVSGERSQDKLIEIAQFVDSQIRDISRVYRGSQPGSLATLAAVNIADQLYEVSDENMALKSKVEQLTDECKQYVIMCEDTKKSFEQYKEQASSAKEEKENAGERIRKLEAMVREYEEKIRECESAYFDLQSENVKLKSRLDTYENT